MPHSLATTIYTYDVQAILFSLLPARTPCMSSVVTRERKRSASCISFTHTLFALSSLLLRKGDTMAPIVTSQAADVDTAIEGLWVDSCNEIASINAGKPPGIDLN